MAINLVKMAQNEKNKTTLFYGTLKVEELKVVLFFHFGLFLLNLRPYFSKIARKGSKWVKFEKNKTTFISSTFKVS